MSTFGSLDAVLAQTPHGPGLLGSAGPISDAFILSTEPQPVINGPIGSAKTTASVKKALVEATRIVPWSRRSDGAMVRRYVLGVWRLKYDLLWSATIASWWKIFPKEIGDWNGAHGRPAQHVIDWEDAFGPVQLVALFKAFGEQADPEDTRGSEYTDIWLNEIDTMPEALAINLAGRVAREPVRSILRRPGRMWGDLNAPDVLNWCYRDYWENEVFPRKLYKQPGGLEANAENPALGREYYLDQMDKNKDRPWWIKRMVHNKPGFTRDADIVYPTFDDDRHLALDTIPVIPSLPVIVSCDGGNMPAAVYSQELPNGQFRVLAEIALETAGMIALSKAMLTLEAARFKGCEFYTVCDPAMVAGEETDEGSDRSRLGKLLGRKVHLARTNEPEPRCDAVRAKLNLTIETGQPAFLLDKSCVRLRRGFNQTFAYRRTRGTNERGGIIKNPDSHPHDALQYGALECGEGHRILLERDRKRLAAQRREEAKLKGRFNPFARRARA